MRCNKNWLRLPGHRERHLGAAAGWLQPRKRLELRAAARLHLVALVPVVHGVKLRDEVVLRA